MKKVGIIGSGNVGQALAKGFIDNGFEVTIASRSAEKEKNWNRIQWKIKNRYS